MPTDVAAATGHHDAGLRLGGDLRPRRRLPARLLRLASDERLVDHVRAGSDAAFEALFDRHHRGVLGFCRHMLGSAEEAEDAVQHTFLAAYRELVGSDKSVQLRPWLYTIARNRCLTVLRTRVRQADGELHDPPTQHLAAEVERRHDLRDLLRDVAALPDDQRAALVLSELGDMSHDEIADVLGCRREKVKALVFQARSSLIASRTARETPCAEIREQLANLRGGSLRRKELRRHLSVCAGCREFRDQVQAQRRDLALVLPVAPTVGLKSAAVGAALGGSAASAPAVGGGAAVAAKALVVAAVAGGGTVAVEAGRSGGDPPTPPPPVREAAPVAGSPVEAGPGRYVKATGARGQGTRAATTTRPRSVGPATPAPAAAPSASGVKPEKRSHAAQHGRRTGHARLKAHDTGKTVLPGANPRAGAKPANPAKPPKAEKPSKLEKLPKAEKPAKAVRPAKPAKLPKTVSAAKPAKPGRAAKRSGTAEPLRAGKPSKPPTAATPAKPAAASDPVKSAKAGTAGAGRGV